MIAVGRLAAEKDLGLADSSVCSGRQDCFTVGNPSRAMVGSNAGTFYGQEASFLTGGSGSGCWVFLYEDASGWHFEDARCSQFPGFLPGPQDFVWVSGCANVRDAPSLRSTIVACLANGVQVAVDSAPVYADAHIWWHLTGRGWMAHDYLVPPRPTPSGCPSSSSTFKALRGAGTLSGASVTLYDSTTRSCTTLVTLPGQPYSPEPHFISNSKVSYLAANGTSSSVLTISLPDSRVQLVATVAGPGVIGEYSWSPDGGTVAYLVDDNTIGWHQWWVKRGNAAATALTSRLTVPGRDGAFNYDESLVQFSSTGRYLVVVDTWPVERRLQIFDTTSGGLIWSAPTSDPPASMAVWSRTIDSLLYFDDKTGVRSIDASKPSQVATVVAGLSWEQPSASADGLSLAYTVRPSFSPQIELLNLQTKVATPIEPGSWRSRPIFVTSDQLWYWEEQPDQHQVHPSVLTGVIFAYDLKSQQESRLPFADVVSVDVSPQ